jgi:tetratricopeptide (TPR) repeat protein
MPDPRAVDGGKPIGLLRLAVLSWALAALAAPQADELAAKSGRAKEAMAAGRFDEAAALYQDLIRSIPGDPGLMFNLGLARFSAGRHREAIAALKEAVRLDPGLATAWLLLGMSHLKLDEPAGALEPLRRAVRLRPDETMARLELADALLSLGRYEECAVQFQRLTELTPRDPRSWYGLGACYLQLSRSAFARLEETAPQSAYWYFLVARSRAEQQQFRSAFYFYRQALLARPGFRGAHAAIAEIYRRLGREDWAATEEEQERALPPPDCTRPTPECHFERSRYEDALRAALKRQDPEGLYWTSRASSELALLAFNRLAELGPSSFFHRLAAETYHLQERHADAVREWRAALALAPNDTGLKLDLARSLMHNQEHEAARGLLEELVRHMPRSAEVHLLLGLCLLNLQEAAQAVPVLESALRLDPRSLGARAALGRAYLQTGRPAEALPHLEAAAATDKDGNLHYLIAQAYLRTGDRDKAQAALRRQQEIRQAAQQRARRREEQFQITAPSP